MTIPAPSRELVLRWMDSCNGPSVVDIIEQVAIKAAAWGYLQQKPESFPKSDDPLEWHHISYRADSVH
jgi:hypothetical protein